MATNFTASTTTTTTTTTDYELTDAELQEFFLLNPQDVLPIEQNKQEEEEEEEKKRDQDVSNLINMIDSNDFIHFRSLLLTPDYLSGKNNNKVFDKMTEEKIYFSKSSINLEQLRSITILMHQVNIIEMEYSLWNHYLRSGMGTLLPSNEVSNFKVWPVNIITKLHRNPRLAGAGSIKQIRSSDNSCVLFITNYLHEINTTQRELREQLDLEKKQFYGYTITMDMTLRTFVQEQLKPLDLQYKYKMKLVEFYYREQLFDYTFKQEQPNAQQMEFVKELFHRKYCYEKASQDIVWIKQPYVQEKKLMKSLQKIRNSVPSFIQSLTNIELRTQLTIEHQRIIKNYQHEMMNIFINLIDAKFKQCEKIFNSEIAQLWQNQRTLPLNERFTTAMIGLIERHLSMIAEKVEYMYHYKNIVNTSNN